VRLEFCVACGSKDGLQHGYLVTKAKGGSDAEPNRITFCISCNEKHEQRYGPNKHSKRIKTGLAARRARGASIGRPKKLMPDQRKEVLQRLESGESRADVARSYGRSKATVGRMVRSAPPASGPESSVPRN
jgi:DNA-binding NarL/FixJ family response regulator